MMSGQFDKVVSVSFKFGSDSHSLYGDYITGEFVYAPVERAVLQHLVDKDDFPKTDGFVKFNELPRTLNEDKRRQLREVGVKASDIFEVFQLNGKRVNNFSDSATRTLPKPMELKMKLGNVDTDLLTINVYSQFLKSGDKLTPDEWDQYHAAILGEYGDLILTEKFREFVIDSETGDIKKGIRYHYLENKYFSERGLNEEEDKEFKLLLDERTKERSSIAIDELKKSTENFKELALSNPSEDSGHVDHAFRRC